MEKWHFSNEKPYRILKPQTKIYNRCRLDNRIKDDKILITTLIFIAIITLLTIPTTIYIYKKGKITIE